MNVKDRPRLGRGLKSLISAPVTVAHPPHLAHPAPSNNGSPEAHTDGDRLALIPVEHIEPNPHQPRASMDPAALQDLANSIKVSGVLQPIIVRPAGALDGVMRYQLIAGHRRTEAAKLAGLTVVPAIVRQDTTDERQAEWALIENIQREDLNAIERAKAYRAYVDKFSLTHSQAAERLGEDRTTITNFLRLLDLNTGVQDLIARGILSAGHAKVLAGVTDPAKQDAFANLAAKDGLSVRKLEELISAPPAGAEPTETTVAAHTRTLTAKSPHVVELEQDLSRKLGTKLRIFPSKKKNTGKIVIQYFSLDEFDRIVDKFN
ncbi:MAG TPA: ParB/RepB/Spo0J family partition protein [Phycisphaerae bacterium]|nr:ParB/RepB/Spo0J family partition protein [Phycisphaerae bacterium]